MAASTRNRTPSRRLRGHIIARPYRVSELTSGVAPNATVADQVECNLGDKSLVKGLVHRLAEGGADATEIQALLGHESLNMSQGSIDATANRTRQAARANRTYRSLEKLTRANTPTGRKAGQREGSRATALPGVPG